VPAHHHVSPITLARSAEQSKYPDLYRKIKGAWLWYRQQVDSLGDDRIYEETGRLPTGDVQIISGGPPVMIQTKHGRVLDINGGLMSNTTFYRDTGLKDFTWFCVGYQEGTGDRVMQSHHNPDYLFMTIDSSDNYDMWGDGNNGVLFFSSVANDEWHSYALIQVREQPRLNGQRKLWKNIKSCKVNLMKLID